MSVTLTLLSCFGRTGCCHYTENDRRDVSNITYCSDSSTTVYFMKEGKPYTFHCASTVKVLLHSFIIIAPFAILLTPIVVSHIILILQM